MKRLALALMCLPGLAFADGVSVENPIIPLAPPGVAAHAAFMSITNTGDTPRQLIGVSAPAYAMAHIHESTEKDGVAMMSAVDLVEIGPGTTVTFEHGGLHFMLMKPKAPVSEGDMIELSLEFANGEVEQVTAMVMKRHKAHDHSGHGHDKHHDHKHGS
ncbi:hypothetical protein ACMU_18895 [Actibacterium mucosum KCTC 23349]|uniref:Copper chaperone PCu(A)C n=1 Tax=Actibacterium mucosum KCTC 23349 TaxID=1454373 RepID=A0A037ZFH6_9RHOB|nr:copper chaperone PCu(A)C [Actibacterium mucosum]KAJ54291.1 hypothetical protein ACMU_18895 [Actibacterium mucosum KCTC 23349]